MLRKSSMSNNNSKMQKAREYVINKSVNETLQFKDKEFTKKIVYSNLYFRFARNAYKSGHYDSASQNLIQSINFCCFNLKSYFLFFRFLFIPLRVFLGRLKKETKC